ncbi:MAG: hydrogenase nickel incorporation protein HypB [Akkermansiaceae bacterium]|nr:hydrogenase nickel incorporation protein HypB [Akkermansiaceae bacterium]
MVEKLRVEPGRRQVIEGDQQTSNDADRIRAAGAPAVQINTGKGCHLDAHMVGHAIERLAPPEGALLMIENVGNLVCPAAFDLGEAHRVVVFSVTEGDDKPLKYNDMFSKADLVLLNKIDLLPHVDFDLESAVAHLRKIIRAAWCCRFGQNRRGLDAWLQWLTGAQAMVMAGRAAALAAQ